MTKKKKFEDEKRIYAVVAASIEGQNGKVIQPPGRQVAQVAHVVSKLRFFEAQNKSLWTPITTIVLQARDAAELGHVYNLLFEKKIIPILFSDTNPEYGQGSYATAICTPPVFKERVVGILDYLPLWGMK